MTQHSITFCFLVPTPEVAVAPQSMTPYNGTVFNLTGSMLLDAVNVDIDIITIWEWSLRGHILRRTETISAPHMSVLTFEPLATNGSGDYLLIATVRPLNGSDFISDSSAVANHSLNIQRKYKDILLCNFICIIQLS